MCGRRQNNFILGEIMSHAGGAVTVLKRAGGGLHILLIKVEY